MPKIDIHFFPDEKKITLNDYVLHCPSEGAASALTRKNILGAIMDGQYEFQADCDNPFIIDCGSEIGIVTFVFKIQYPDARILCFEPDPIAFKFLEKNVLLNKLQNVTLVNAALAKKEGMIDFFGQINTANPDTRGNSIISSWGNQRDYVDSIKVRAVELASYLNFKIDFLKIDIEAAEQQVLENIESKLGLIKNIHLDIHQCNDVETINDIDEIKDILERNNFKISIVDERKDMVWPTQVKNWVDKVSPHLFTICATRV